MNEYTSLIVEGRDSSFIKQGILEPLANQVHRPTVTCQIRSHLRAQARYLRIVQPRHSGGGWRVVLWQTRVPSLKVHLHRAATIGEHVEDVDRLVHVLVLQKKPGAR